jgi:hypothetical protein
MNYRSEDGLVSEKIWNSRDGVTPFCVLAKDGKTMISHVDWHKDRRLPDFAPPPGTRYFASITSEEIRQRAEESADRIIAANNGILPSYLVSKQLLIEGLADGYKAGETPIIKTAPDLY